MIYIYIWYKIMYGNIYIYITTIIYVYMNIYNHIYIYRCLIIDVIPLTAQRINDWLIKSSRSSLKLQQYKIFHIFVCYVYVTVLTDLQLAACIKLQRPSHMSFAEWWMAKTCSCLEQQIEWYCFLGVKQNKEKLPQSLSSLRFKH